MIVIIFYLLQFLFCYSIAINLRQPTEGDAKVIAYDLIGARKLKHSGFDKRSTDDLTINGTVNKQDIKPTDVILIAYTACRDSLPC